MHYLDYFCKKSYIMNELELIRSKIYDIRGLKVMIDRDLAEMYGVTTGNLNKAVKRNSEDFGRLHVRLTAEEWDSIRSLIFQNGIPKGRGGSRYLPYAFTEQGVAMLSSVLNGETAIRINIGIMRAFVAIRQMLSQPQTDKFSILEKRVEKLEKYIEEVITDVNDVNEDTRMQIELINESLAGFQAEKRLLESKRCKVGFKP